MIFVTNCFHSLSSLWHRKLLRIQSCLTLSSALYLPCRGFPGGTSGKEPACQCRRHKRRKFDPWIRKIPWRRKWQPTPAFLPEKFHGQRSLASCSPWGRKESDVTEQLSTHTQTHRDQTCSRPGSLLTHELSTENRFWEQLSPCGMEETSGRNSRWWFLWPKSWTPWTSLNAFVPTILLLTVKQPKVTYLQCFIP